MTRIRVLTLAALMALAPLSPAVAQSSLFQLDVFAQVGGPLSGSLRQNQAREEAREGQRMDLGDVVRRVSSGRPGRMLGVSERGGGDRLVYVVRWEYPGGRIADISVDGRTGRVIGER